MEQTNADSNMEQSSEVLETPVESNPRRDSFVEYWSNKPDQIPEKFNDAGSWFDSIQELEKSYTQKSQENAELRKKLEQIQATEQEETTETVEEPEVPDTPLSVIKEEEPENTEVPTEEPKEIPQEKIDQWRDRFLMNGGEFDADLKAEIKATLRAPDSLVTQVEMMYKAQVKEANQIAANSVGGVDNLQAILDYTSRTSSPEQQIAITRMLNNPETWETTLLGLKAKWEARPQSKEPARTPTGVPSNAVSTQTKPFETKAEMYSAQDAYLKAETPKERQALYEAFSRRLEVTYAAGNNSLSHLS